MVWPADKETFPTWLNKDLPTDELGTEIDADILNDVFRLLERIEDSLGVSFISGYADLKERLDALPTQENTFVLSQLVQGKL